MIAHVDITPRKRMEAENQKTLHELAHMNMRAGMGELVSVVTHEINQPLTASLGNAQALRRMLASKQLPEGSEFLPIVEDIIDANRRAADVINRIRTVMRKEEFEMQPLDFNAIVADIIRMLNPSAANEGIVMTADLDPDLPAIPGDRVQLRQVAMNLIVNAVQATRSKGGEPPIVRVKTSVRNSDVALMVEDGGTGFRKTPHVCSNPTSRRNRKGWASVCRLRARSWNRTAAPSRSPISPKAARAFQ